MKRFFLALVLIVGLGGRFSSSQSASLSDPFSRYLAGVKDGMPESTLLKFGSECGVNVANTQPRYAAGPGSSFALMKDLARGLHSLDTDFYSTAEVWNGENRILVEIWANSDDVGSEARYYKCFESGKLMAAEVTVWNLPLDKTSGFRAWGYSRRWERGADGQLQRTKAEFVDAMERSIPKPKLDENDQKSLRWTPPLGPLIELKLPPSMFR